MSIEGKWFNQLGSVMTLKVDQNGVLSGTYKTAVSEDGGSITADLVGLIDDPADESPSLGFVVAWKGMNSVTSWSGQLVVDEGSEPRIETTWILTIDTSEPKRRWMSSMVGHDVFTRADLSKSPAAQPQSLMASRPPKF